MKAIHPVLAPALAPRSIGLLLALITLLVYLPATSCHFINFDDPDYVTENQTVQGGLTWEGVKWAFDGSHAANWHPLTWLSHMLDCDLFHLNPAGPHLVNILLHALNAALLFALLFRLTEKLWPAALVAALFAWHPLHVESVAWVSERKDVLSTFFTLLTLLSYVRFVGGASGDERRMTDDRLTAPSSVIRRPSRFYWLALFFFVLSLLSKPMPVTLPLVMLLLDYWPLGRFQTSDFKSQILPQLLEKGPFLLLSAASCVITFFSQRDSAVVSLAGLPLELRLENAVLAYAGYLWKMIWPRHLAIFYPYVAVISRLLVVELALIFTGVSVIAWRERKFFPWLIVGWLWFLVTLVPVIGLVQVGGQSMADRYSYFPLVGIFLAIVFSVETLANRLVFFKRWLATAAIVILGVYVCLTEKQLRYWRDSETLFTHALTVADSSPAHLSLGTAFRDQNRMPEALTQYIMAFRLDSALSLSWVAWSDIGWILYCQGKFEIAAVYYRGAVQLNPKAALPYDNFSLVLMKLKRWDEAANELSIAAQKDASLARPHYLMGWLRLQQGRDAEAVPYLHQALQLEPNDLEALLLLSSALAADEDPQVRNGTEAHALAEKAVKLTYGQQPAAFDTLAMSYAEIGNFSDAILFQQQAIQLAQAANQAEDVALMQKRLESYQKQQPWRDSFKNK